MPAVIYPPNIKKDKDKLFAVYSLMEQMRLEHNSKATDLRSRLALESIPEKWLIGGELDESNPAVKEARKKRLFRDWCPEGFMLADTPENNSLRAKFRTYAHESKRLQKQLLAERNRLVEKIRWANYTYAQWKAVSKLSEEEQIAIYQTLFGDKNTERVKTTPATSTVLDELKALNLDDMPETLGTDPTETLSGYTEVDPATYIATTADRVTVTELDTDIDAYIYKDKGIDHFNGDFEHLMKVCGTDYSAATAGKFFFFWMLTNDIDDRTGLRTASKSFLESYLYNDTSLDWFLRLSECDGGTIYRDTASVAEDTTYYLEIERDEDVGTYGTFYMYICTTDYWDDGGDQVDTLTGTLHTAKRDFQYIFATNTYNDGVAGEWVSGWMELLDLQEAVAPTAIQQAATNIGNTVARINGKISDDGGATCEARFRWRRTGGVETLRPDAAGDETNIPEQYPDSGLHYAKVDEEIADDNSSYVQQDGAEWDRDFYNLPAYSGSRIINSITLYFRVLASSSAGRVKGAIKSNSTVTETAEKDPYGDFGAAAWGTYSQEWTTNPATGENWTPDDIDDLQIGISLYISGTHCTQLYIEVDWGTTEGWSTSEWQNTLETEDEYYEDLTELDPDTEYEFQTQAKNSAGEGEWSASAYFETLAGQPTMRRWGGSILPAGAQRIGKGW